jgi:hypothetical protein
MSFELLLRDFLSFTVHLARIELGVKIQEFIFFVLEVLDPCFSVFLPLELILYDLCVLREASLDLQACSSYEKATMNDASGVPRLERSKKWDVVLKQKPQLIKIK